MSQQDPPPPPPPSSSSTRPSPTPPPSSTPHQQQQQQQPPPSSSSSKRRVPPPCWTHEETSALIDAYHDKWYSLRRGNLKASHWQDVADSVAVRCNLTTPSKTSVQCRHKIEKLRKRYRTEKQRALTVPNHRRFSSSWVYFKKMDFMEKGPSSSATATAADSDSNNDEDDDGGGDDDDAEVEVEEEEEEDPNHGYARFDVDDQRNRYHPPMTTNGGGGGGGGSGGGGFRFRIPGGSSSRSVPNVRASEIPKPTKSYGRFEEIPKPNRNYGRFEEMAKPSKSYGRFDEMGKPKNYGRFDEVPKAYPSLNNGGSNPSSSMFHNGSWSRCSTERKSNGGSGGGGGGGSGNGGRGKREMDPVAEMVSSIRLLGEGFVKMEQMKIDMAREMEQMRMEMEMKRTEMILESQERIIDAFAKGFTAPKKKVKRMPSSNS